MQPTASTPDERILTFTLKAEPAPYGCDLYFICKDQKTQWAKLDKMPTVEVMEQMAHELEKSFQADVERIGRRCADPATYDLIDRMAGQWKAFNPQRTVDPTTGAAPTSQSEPQNEG